MEDETAHVQVQVDGRGPAVLLLLRLGKRADALGLQEGKGPPDVVAGYGHVSLLAEVG